MSTELLLALFGFAAITLVTPGPNNMMLLASGANFGYRPTIPHLFGISIGFGLMVVLVGMGLMTLFELYPPLQNVLKVISVAFLVWLAWKIAHSAAPGGTGPDGAGTDGPARPIGFFQAAAFQWVNPKAWTMALTAIAAYAPERSLAAVALIATTFLVLNFFSGSFWMLLGRETRRLLSNPRRLTIFNWTMAGLLLATLIPVVFA